MPGQNSGTTLGPSTNIQSKWRMARDAMREAEDRMLAGQGRPAVGDDVFKVGDLALLHVRNYPQLRPHKLATPFIGPFKVVKVLSPTVVELDLPGRFRLQPVINIDQLKKYNNERGLAEARPQPVGKDTQGNDMFIVERILQERTQRGKRQYLVRWQGYGPGDDSWEPEEAIKKLDALRIFKLAQPARNPRSRRNG